MAADEKNRWGSTEVLLTVLGVLGGVALGAWIFYVAVKTRQGGDAPSGASPHLGALIGQIRQYIRMANQSDSAMAGLTNAAAASALLDNAEATYGSALAGACNVEKLRGLIQKVQERHSKALGPVTA